MLIELVFDTMTAYAMLPRTVVYDGNAYELCGKFGTDGHLLAYIKDSDFAKCLVSSRLEDKDMAAEELRVQLIALHVLQP